MDPGLGVVDGGSDVEIQVEEVDSAMMRAKGRYGPTQLRSVGGDFPISVRLFSSFSERCLLMLHASVI